MISSCNIVLHLKWITILSLLICVKDVGADGLLEGTLDGLLGPNGIVNGVLEGIPNLVGVVVNIVGAKLDDGKSGKYLHKSNIGIPQNDKLVDKCEIEINR
ncbi:hypothetical protein NPIL_675151 [Nephila pilipes]|uniref:Uncharacterized protein n=1 Tax=Nephila pilipes TaxID=299642 RepID=A0A8X6QIU4_NEPPI|nr:hypothetical protein NPIL_675151 [Nephila pilipes]